ncbi:hypothetical protein D3C87_2040680 [compost metagenome]
MHPDLIASRNTNGKPSEIDVNTKIFAFLYLSSKAFRSEIAPVNETLSFRLGLFFMKLLI